MSVAAPPSAPAVKPKEGLVSLWRHRSLLWRFTRRTIDLRHKGSFLGILWSLVNPLLMLGLYTLVFGIIFGGSFGKSESETTLDYALGIFLGLTVFHLLADVLAASPLIIPGQSNLVKKVVFPLQILPAATTGSAIFHFVLSLGIALVGVLAVGPSLTWQALWFPLIVLPVLVLALGLSYLLAALGVFLRDLAQLTQFLSLALLYASGVFYSVSDVPSGIWMFLRFNPLIHAVEAARGALLWGLPPDGWALAYLYGFAAALLLAGYTLFMRLKSGFADVL